MVENNGVDYGEILENLGAKPSQSEERGLSTIDDTDLIIFSPGISSAGFAEIRMAKSNNDRKIIATTIDEKGLNFANEVIDGMGLNDQIETRFEDLRAKNEYPDEYFDVIYARLVLHYLSSQDLDKVLSDFYRTLKSNKKLFVVVRSEKNIPDKNSVIYDENTKMTTITHYNPDGSVRYLETRYLHTPETICDHLSRAGFTVEEVEEYQEQLYKDFARKEIAPVLDHIIEVRAKK